MGKDHKLYYEAYNDASDLNNDGVLDVGEAAVIGMGAVVIGNVEANTVVVGNPSKILTS